MINPKTKIIYCITKSVYGGAGKYVLELASGLPKDEFDVLVVLGGSGILTKKLKAGGIKTVSLPSLERDIDIKNDLTVLRELVSIFKREKPDVIHLNSSKIGGIGALAGRLAGVKNIIFTAHGWPFNEDRNIFVRSAIRFASWITVLLSTKTITISRSEYAQGRSMPFCKNKVVLIRNGIEKTESVFNKEEAVTQLQKKMKGRDLRGKFLIGTTAELHKNKGLIYALLAIKELPEKIREKILYVIMGSGEEYDFLDNFIAKNHLGKYIVLAGFVENASEYLSAFDIFLFPSIKEGLPYAIMEAGLVKLPVITTNVGGIPDMIENEKTGLLISPKDPNEIKRALVDVIGNKEKAERLGKELHKKILTEFGQKQMVEKTIEVYKV